MRHLLVLPLIMLVLATACRGGSDTGDARLVAIDSLTAAAPDSALTLLATIDTAALDESDRAYHAMLTSQAAYKAFADSIIMDSTIIDRALRYYTTHNHPDRTCRTLLWAGVCRELNGQPLKALDFYLQSASSTVKRDHRNAGYANLRIAQLLRDNFAAPDNIIGYYRTALAHFEQLRDTTYIISCLNNIGGTYRSADFDSAAAILKRVADISLQYGDSSTYFSSLQLMERGLYFDSCYAEAKELAVFCASKGPRFVTDEIYYDLARNYAKLGLVDSAEHYFAMADPGNCDSAMLTTRYYALSRIAYAKGQYHKAIMFDDTGDSISQALTTGEKNTAISEMLDAATENERMRQLDFAHKIDLLLRTTLAVSFLILLALAGMVVAMLRKWDTKIAALLNETQNEHVNSHDELIGTAAVTDAPNGGGEPSEQPQHNDAQAEQAADGDTAEPQGRTAQLLEHYLDTHIETMRELIDLSHHLPAKQFVDAFLDKMAQSPEKDIWECVDLDKMLTDEKRRAIEYIDRKCQLTDRERRIVTLLACGFSDLEVRVMYHMKDSTGVRVTLTRIKQKGNLRQTVKSILRTSPSDDNQQDEETCE